MATEYTQPDGDDPICGMLIDVLARWHPHIGAAVRIGLMYAFNDDGPAIKVRGVQALASVKVMNVKDRVKWGFDVELLVDGAAWERMPDDRRLALLDHECSHLELVLDDNGNVKMDVIGRPRVVTIPADLNPSDAFVAVIERHGRSAAEVISANAHMDEVEEALKRHVLGGS